MNRRTAAEKDYSMNLKTLVSAGLYDIAEQRPVFADDFRTALEFRTPAGKRMLLRSDRFGIVLTAEWLDLPDGFRFRICGGTLAEENSIRWRLMSLRVLPDLLNTKVGSEGAYFLPVWSGALADFRKREHCRNSDRIYMEQREWEKFSMLNCFGLLQKDNNFFAVVESGDFNCRVESEFNRDGINSLCANFIFRNDPSDMVSAEDRTVAFHRLQGKACYGDFAKIYRTFLLEHGASFLTDRMQANPVLRYSANAMRTKIFLAGKEPFVPDGSSPVTVHTSFAEAEKILDSMKKSGIGRAVITLVGWNLGGHDGAYPSHFPVEPALGGEAGLRRLIAHADRLGYQIVPHDNVTDIYRGSPDFDPEYVARMKSGEPIAAGVWGGGQSYKACPQVFLRRWGSEFERIRKLGFKGHYYMDAQSTVLWRCDSPAHPADEREFALALAAITEVPRSMYGAVSIECPSAYSISYIDEAAAVHSPAGEPYLRDVMPAVLKPLSLHPVPFFHIALHGLILYQQIWVNCCRDVRHSQLTELAFGARPCMEVSYRNNGGNGGDYRKSIKLVKPAYDLCFNKLKLQTVPFDSFHEPVPGFYDTAYENGVRIRVNTTDSEFDGVPAKDWKLN